MQGRGIFGLVVRNTTITCCEHGVTRAASFGRRAAGAGGATAPRPAYYLTRRGCGVQLWCPASKRGYTSSRSAHGGDAAAAAKKSLPEDLRRLLRYLANSVVVCTAQPPAAAHAAHAGRPTASSSRSPPPPAPVGLTMSSFTSLSLHPSPVVSFNIAMPSRTEAAIVQARHFMIHILSGDARGARVADIFRSGNAHPTTTSDELALASCAIVWPADQPPGAHHQPYLRGPGIRSVLRCRLLDEPLGGLVPVRDHVVVLGEVMEVLPGGEASEEEEVDEPPFGLVYGNQHYRQLRGAVVKAGPRR